jgi:ribonuclease HI
VLEVVVIFPKEIEYPDHSMTRHDHTIVWISKEEIDIFTDGSEKDGVAGSGIVFHTNPPTSVAVHTPREQTNNNAELFTIEKALTITPTTVRCIQLFTDSWYTINTICTNETTGENPSHNVPNWDTLHNIKTLLTQQETVQFHHIYSHVKEKLAVNSAAWKPKINEQKRVLPIHYPTVCKLNNLADLAANKGQAMMPILIMTHPNLYPLSRVVIHNGSRVSPIPRMILRGRWMDQWPKPPKGRPRHKNMTSAQDTGIYGFLLHASHGILPL